MKIEKIRVFISFCEKIANKVEFYKNLYKNDERKIKFYRN